MDCSSCRHRVADHRIISAPFFANSTVTTSQTPFQNSAIFYSASPTTVDSLFCPPNDLEVVQFPDSNQSAMAANATDPLWTLEELLDDGI
jgi:hypothetical protein